VTDALDFKKVYKDLYSPGTEPAEILVPAMTFVMTDGRGDPNAEGGAYQQAVELLYAIAYAIKMSPKRQQAPAGYYDYVVPPLEGLWWLEDPKDFDFSQKEKFCWTMMIRQPEFVTGEVFEKICDEVKKKKPALDTGKARLQIFEEGLCVQAMHIGPFATEDATLKKIETYIRNHGLANDISAVLPDGMVRRHHEIYLGDPRKTAPEKLKTVLRHPVRRA
jgi:hypothetical protein